MRYLIAVLAVLLALAAWALTAHGVGEEAEAAPRRPNIVILLADDLGYADVGCHGLKEIATPHIDSIAENGIRFTDGYANHPVCAPSRAGLLSGRYQQRFGFEHNPGRRGTSTTGFGLPTEIPILAERMKEAGYTTGMIGKWHLGFRKGMRPHERGFDFSYGFLAGGRSYFADPDATSPLFRNGVKAPEEEYLTYAFGREAGGFIDRNKDQPFLLYVAFNAVHTPMHATAQDKARNPGLRAGKRKTFGGMLTAMDDAVGLVLAKLEEHDLLRNTLVVFYSDNGGPTRKNTSKNDPLRGYKNEMYEGGIGVPFLLQWPGKLPAGVVSGEMVMGFDVHATALSLAGAKVSPEEPIDGVDLMPFLTGESEQPPHRQLFWRAGEAFAVRQGNYKLVRQDEGAPMLFDLGSDLGEQNDLSAEQPEKAAELKAAFDAWAKGMIPAKWVR